MKKFLIVLVALILSTCAAFAQQTIFPCDTLAGVTARPYTCLSNYRLASDYTGNALTAQRQSLATTQTIPFVNDRLDTASLFAFLSTDTTGRVIRWNDQRGNCDAVINSTVSPPVQPPQIGGAPPIPAINVGGAPAIIFPGGHVGGQVFGLDLPSSCFAAANVTPKEYTIFIVARPTSSAYRNQAFTPGTGSGTFVSLEGVAPFSINGQTTVGGSQILNATPSAGIQIGMVVSTKSDGPFPNPVQVASVVGTTVNLFGSLAATTYSGPILVSNPLIRTYSNGDATPGGMAVADFNAFTFQPTDYMLETGDTVLVFTSSAARGTKFYQNENPRSSGGFSLRTDPVQNAFIGRMGLSQTVNFGVPGSCQVTLDPCGPFSLSGDFWASAVLIYNYGMTDRERAIVSSALYTAFNDIPQQRSSPMNRSNLLFLGDSITSGYSATALNGYSQLLQNQLPSIHVGNYSLPGSQVGPSVGTPACCYNLGQVPLQFINNVATFSKGKNAVFLMAGGNDMGSSGQFAGSVSGPASPAVVTVTAHGKSANDRVAFVTTPPAPLATSATTYYVKTVLDPNTYTISATPGGAALNTSGAGGAVTVLQYAKTAASIFADYQATVAAIHAINPNIKVFGSTVLPRTGTLYNFILPATNALIVAGAGGAPPNDYQLVDLASVPCLNDPTSACYDDGTHPTNLGMSTIANNIFLPINAYFFP